TFSMEFITRQSAIMEVPNICFHYLKFATASSRNKEGIMHVCSITDIHELYQTFADFTQQRS
ncbi:hypothetical protein Dimus_029029, partial [Dionaea muscipula]